MFHQDVKVYNKQTKTFQIIAHIDFNNRCVDTYGDTEPMYNIPFADVTLTSIQFCNVVEKVNESSCNTQNEFARYL